MNDQTLSRVLTALLSLVFTGLVLVLPPIVSRQLASAEHTLEKPLVGFIVAAAVFLVAASSASSAPPQPSIPQTSDSQNSSRH